MFESNLFKSITLKQNDFAFCPEITTKVSLLGISIKEVPINYSGRTYIEGKKIKATDGIKAILALGNIDDGKKVFKQCAACHSISKGGSNKIGPALWGVIGRKAGAVDDYKYSKAMSELGKNWNFTSMNSFLIKPKDYVTGTKMAYAGLKKEKDRASIILYLNEQGDAPVPLP